MTSFLTLCRPPRGETWVPGSRVRPGRVWLPAGALYDLRVAAGVNPKPPQYPGRIVWTSAAYVATLRVKANVKRVFE